MNSTHSYLFLIAAISALGGLLFGFDTGVIAGGLIFIRKTFPVSTLVQEVIVSSVVLGALAGAIFSGRLADWFGRRKTLLMTALVFIIGTLVASLATDVYSLIAGRLILGLAIGVSSFVVPLFISEMSPAKYRGALVLLNVIAITGGETVAFLVDYALASTESWRLMFAAGLVPAILLFVGTSFLPSSPRWLVLKGFPIKARVVLLKIRPQYEVDQELQAIEQHATAPSSSWKSLFSKKIRPVLMIGLSLAIMQQFVGINTVMYYGPMIFKSAGFQGASSQILATLGMGLVNTVMSLVALLIVDRVGRRKLLLWGTLIASISLLLISFTFSSAPLLKYPHWITLFNMLFYIAGYSMSLGAIFWLVISEIYPLAVRSIAMSLVTGVMWGANFIVAMTFLSIVETIGTSNIFLLYGMVSITTFFLCYFFVPETRGITLEEIEAKINAGVPTRELGEPK